MIPETKKPDEPLLGIPLAPTTVPQPVMPAAAAPVPQPADTPQSQQRQPSEQKPVLDDKYAQALIHMVKANYDKEQALKPKHSIISKRMMWLVIIPTILSIIFFIFISMTTTNKAGETPGIQKDEQTLLDSGGFLKDASR